MRMKRLKNIPKIYHKKGPEAWVPLHENDIATILRNCL